MFVDEYNDALVLGLGKSGLAAARLLLAQGTVVTAVDRASTEAVEARAARLRAAGVGVETGRRDLPKGHYDVCVASPGLPVDSGWIAEMAELGVPVISELELAYQCCPCSILAITGTNGKSTMTRLCGDMLTAAGLRVAVGGNYGTPACETVAGEPVLDWVVWEVSSFQLETCHTFKPRIGVILNIAPDHLDRHGSLARYAELKVSMLKNMDANGTAIIPAAQYQWIEAGMSPPISLLTFGTGDNGDYTYADGMLSHGEASLSITGTPFDNPIIGQTAAAAWAVADRCGIPPKSLSKAIQSFRALPHRMQQVAVHKGVTYIDDSKATNLAALKAGVQMAGGSVRLIAGGLLKEKDLESVKEVLANAVQTVYLVGDAAGLMEAAWKEVVECRCCSTMKRAVQAAASDAVNGERVLLSPGCASFDQYPNYEARGNDFAELVSQLET